MVQRMKARAVKEKKREGVEPKAKVRNVVIAILFVFIVGAVAGVAIYLDRVAPFRATVIEVDGSSITMRYFLNRTLMSRIEPMVMLQTLTNEEIIKQVVPKPPYNISISEEDIERYLREVAQGKSDTIAEKEFKEWYRQQLNESRLSESEFRDLTRTNLLSRRLTEYLAERVPSVAEQVRLRMIPVENLPDAKRVKERLDAGEDFGAVAREVSSDETLRQNGGELGWFPRGALFEEIAQAAFDELAVGEASEPLYLDEKHFMVIMVSEKAAAREMDEESRQRIKSRVLDDWLKEEFQHHQVKFHGFHNGYDSETDAWVQWQLQKMRR